MLIRSAAPLLMWPEVWQGVDIHRTVRFPIYQQKRVKSTTIGNFHQQAPWRVDGWKTDLSRPRGVAWLVKNFCGVFFWFHLRRQIDGKILLCPRSVTPSLDPDMPMVLGGVLPTAYQYFRNRRLTFLFSKFRAKFSRNVWIYWWIFARKFADGQQPNHDTYNFRQNLREIGHRTCRGNLKKERRSSPSWCAELVLPCKNFSSLQNLQVPRYWQLYSSEGPMRMGTTVQIFQFSFSDEIKWRFCLNKLLCHQSFLNLSMRRTNQRTWSRANTCGTFWYFVGYCQNI